MVKETSSKAATDGDTVGDRASTRTVRKSAAKVHLAWEQEKPRRNSSQSGPKKPTANPSSKPTKSKPTFDAANIPNTSDEEEVAPPIMKVGPPKKAKRLIKRVDERERSEPEDVDDDKEVVASSKVRRQGQDRHAAAESPKTCSGRARDDDDGDEELKGFEEPDSGKEQDENEEDEPEESEPEDDLVNLVNNPRALLKKLEAEEAQWVEDDAEDANAIEGLMRDDPSQTQSGHHGSSSPHPTSSRDKQRTPTGSPSSSSSPRKRGTEDFSEGEDNASKPTSKKTRTASTSTPNATVSGKGKAREVTSRKRDEQEKQAEREQQRREQREQQKWEEQHKEHEHQLRELERMRQRLEQEEDEEQVRPERQAPSGKRAAMEKGKGKEPEQGQNRKREQGKHGHKNASAANKANASAANKTNASATGKANAGATGKANGGATGKVNVGTVGKVNVGATDKANVSARKKRSKPDEDIAWADERENGPSGSENARKRKRINQAADEESELSEIDVNNELDCAEGNIAAVTHTEGRIRLTDQSGRVQRICDVAIKELLAEICIKNTFPDGPEKSADFAKSALIVAAKSLKYNDVTKKLRSDEDYGRKLASIPAQHIYNLRGKVKKASDPLVAMVFNLDAGNIDKVCWLHDGLRYIYLHNYESDSVDGEKAYNQPIFYQVLRNVFFNKPRSFGFSIADRFESSHPEKLDEKEIPAALLALAAMAVFASIEDLRSARGEVGDFKSNVFIDAYRSNMDILSEIKSDNISAYHRLMHGLYCKLTGMSASSVQKGAKNFLNTKDMAQ